MINRGALWLPELPDIVATVSVSKRTRTQIPPQKFTSVPRVEKAALNVETARMIFVTRYTINQWLC